MPTFRYPDENDLLAAGRTSLPSGDHEEAPCPDRESWLDFVRGAYAHDPAITESLLAHLAHCSRCATSLRDIRAQRMRRPQTPAVLVVLAAVIVCAIAVGLWYKPHNTSATAVADLREIAAMRGPEMSTAPAVITLARSTRTLRVILPVGSGRGAYEVGLFQGGEPLHQLISATREAVEVSSRIEVSVPFDFSGLAVGRYFLGLRVDSAQWDLYPINIQ